MLTTFFATQKPTFYLLALVTIGSCTQCLCQPGTTLQPQAPTISEMVAKINTQVDPNYVYPFEKTKYVPPKDKTLLIMGQTVEGIKEYNAAFPDTPKPGGWSAYWAVTEFVGVTDSHTNTTGSSQDHQMLVEQYPNAAIHSAMWMVGKWNVAKFTTDGAYDKVIKRYCRWLKKVDRPVYLRLGYEFDGPHNQLEPTEYIKAYKHIVDLMRSQGVNNVAFVWHSYASTPYKGYPLSRWYPGDDYVDWVGISLFGHCYSKTGTTNEAKAVLDFAKQRKKPVMIAEASPIYGIPEKDTSVWENWFVNFFSLTYNKNIKAICFINEDWTRLRIEGLSQWKDARLTNNSQVAKAWFMETDKARYLKASPELFQQLGYSKK